MIELAWRSFSSLSTEQLYAILAIRSQIFIVEQGCLYWDPDGADQKAMHLLGQENGRLVAYLRLLPPTPTQHSLVFGRVLVAQAARGKGYGKDIMHALLSHCSQQYPSCTIQCSAQHHLQDFYKGFGFSSIGKPYYDAGILHILMQK